VYSRDSGAARNSNKPRQHHSVAAAGGSALGCQQVWGYTLGYCLLQTVAGWQQG
jgi:hypothetical protein